MGILFNKYLLKHKMLLTHETSQLSPPPTHTPPTSQTEILLKVHLTVLDFSATLLYLSHSAGYPHGDDSAVSSSQNVWEEKGERGRKERDTLMLRLRMRKFSLLRNLRKASHVSLTQTGSSLHWPIPESVMVREDKVIITGLTITHSREDAGRANSPLQWERAGTHAQLTLTSIY